MVRCAWLLGGAGPRLSVGERVAVVLPVGWVGNDVKERDLGDVVAVQYGPRVVGQDNDLVCRAGAAAPAAGEALGDRDGTVMLKKQMLIETFSVAVPCTYSPLGLET